MKILGVEAKTKNGKEGRVKRKVCLSLSLKIQEGWNALKSVINAAREVCDETNEIDQRRKGKRRWSFEVPDAARKKKAFRMWRKSKSEQNKKNYKEKESKTKGCQS